LLIGIDFNEANLPVGLSASFRHRVLIEGSEGGSIQRRPQEKENKHEKPASPPLPYLEGMACRPEREEKNCAMDSVFFAMGGWCICQNYPAGMTDS